MACEGASDTLKDLSCGQMANETSRLLNFTLTKLPSAAINVPQETETDLKQDKDRLLKKITELKHTVNKRQQNMFFLHGFHFSLMFQLKVEKDTFETRKLVEADFATAASMTQRRVLRLMELAQDRPQSYLCLSLWQTVALVGAMVALVGVILVFASLWLFGCCYLVGCVCCCCKTYEAKEEGFKFDNA